MTRTVTAGLTYFAAVFAAGFFFGMIRVPLLLPRFGERTSELIEMPFMCAVIIIASRWLVRRFGLEGKPMQSLLAGSIGAIALLVVEFSVILWIRGLSPSQFLDQRDPVAAVMYYAMVAFFAVAPFVFSKYQKRR